MRLRSKVKEWMDDADLDSTELVKTLHEIAWLNKHLGGHRNVLSGITSLRKKLNKGETHPFSVIDLGCGLGDCLFILSDKSHWKLTGIDMNKRTLEEAKKTAGNRPVQFIQAEVTPESVSKMEADVLMFNLFLHHFSEEEIEKLLLSIDPEKVGSLLINDLRRSSISLILYKLVSSILRFNPMARNDGSISIQKGFTTSEWKALLAKLACREIIVQNRWAFRHQITVLF